MIKSLPPDPPEIATRENLAAILIFALCLAVGWTASSYYFPYVLEHDHTIVGTMVAKDLNPGLYPRDYAFKDDSLYRHYIPLVRQLFGGLARLTGSFEKGLLVLVPAVVLVYAVGMALLTFRLSQSLWAALLITFLSIPYRPAPPGEIWGVGGAEFLLARTLATALVPYVFLVFFSLLETPGLRKGLLTGALTGLLAYLHPPTGLFVGEITVVLYGLTYIREPRRWPALGAMVLACGLVALYPLTLMERAAPVPGAPVDFAELRQVIQTYLKIPTNWGSFPGEATERRVWLLLGASLLFGLNYLCRPALKRPQALRHTWLWGGLLILYLCWRASGKGAGLGWLYALAALYLALRYRREGPDRMDWSAAGPGFFDPGPYLCSLITA